MTESLRAGAAKLGVTLDQRQAQMLARLLDELQLWARAYNLTAIGAREEMITHHLLDSLSIAPYLHGTRIADLGTGAGFPGLPLAIACPDREFTLVDSTAKKIRFIEHAARTLQLGNVRAIHGRIEQLAHDHDDGPWHGLIARALAPLDKLLPLVAPLCTAGTQLLAMCGKRPDAELAALPDHWRLRALHSLTVPGLDAERHLLILERETA